MSLELQNSFLGASFSVHTYFLARKSLRSARPRAFVRTHGIARPARGTAKPAPSTSFVIQSYKNKHSAGFTLLEILLSIAAIALIAGISVPIYQAFQVRNDLDIAATTIASSLRRAQVLAQASDGDVNSGVYVQAGSITLFRGVNYVARNATLDEIFEMPTSIVPSGTAEVVFNKFTGLPVSVGTITLTSTVNKIENITINAKGNIDY
jgi:prepilin-type N-terminal cleavage/methylation domain-containing protein